MNNYILEKLDTIHAYYKLYRYKIKKLGVIIGIFTALYGVYNNHLEITNVKKQQEVMISILNKLNDFNTLAAAINSTETARKVLPFLSKEGKEHRHLKYDTVDLSSLDLRGLNSPYASITNSNFFGSDLSKSVLNNADFECSTLTDAKLNNANLDDAKFNLTNVTRTKFINTKISLDQLKQACINKDELHGNEPASNILPIVSNITVSPEIFKACQPLQDGIRPCR
jgi:uncharacterized protein YjbI with pentapeptide repeats